MRNRRRQLGCGYMSADFSLKAQIKPFNMSLISRKKLVTILSTLAVVYGGLSLIPILKTFQVHPVDKRDVFHQRKYEYDPKGDKFKLNMSNYRASETSDRDKSDEKKIVHDELGTRRAATNESRVPNNDDDEKRMGFEKNRLYVRAWDLHHFNELVSDKISVDRVLPDARSEECQQKEYSADLPDTSVIICFHNEAWSVILRTVHSVHRTAPPSLLREIILVDDFSTLDYLKAPLEVYMHRFPKVRLHRNSKREGLIRSRLKGASLATAQTLTFLDSHIECNEGWLPPLLARIQDGEHHVVYPIVDLINVNTFKIVHQNESTPKLPTFDWSLNFRWKEPIQQRQDKTSPIATSVMPGGLFTINRHFFYKIGSYDDGMDLWGAENLEISFRIWMCGGTLELIPCARIAHIFRLSLPYPLPEVLKSWNRNRNRLAEVWLDDMANMYYAREPSAQKSTYNGDIQGRRDLRRKLDCKTFDWFLENVAPNMLNPKQVLQAGQMRNDDAPELCLNAVTDKFLLKERLRLMTCFPAGFNEQRWYFMKTGQIRLELHCLDIITMDAIVNECDVTRTTQIFVYRDDRSIYQPSSGYCLEKKSSNFLVRLAPCTGLTNQKWRWEPWLKLGSVVNL